MSVAAEIATIVGGTQAATNLGVSIHKAFQSIRPYSKYKKWNIRVQQIAAEVASAADKNSDVITREELEGFLKVLGDYAAARDSFYQSIKDGTCTHTWYGKGKLFAEHFSAFARDAVDTGEYLSTEASTRRLQLCLDNKPETSAVQVPATSTSDSLASSGSCQPIEPQTPSSLQVPPLYSAREGDNDAIRVNLEDDTEDDSNDMALQDVYNHFWSQIPEEQSPWASTASLRDKLRRLGVLL